MKLKLSVVVMSIALLTAIFFRPVRSQTVTFEPPNRDSAEDSRSGTSRSIITQCQSDEKVEPELTPIVPPSQLGLTVSAHPTFYVYIPPTSASYAQFTLKDQGDGAGTLLEERGVYQTTLPLDGAGGIVAIPLPDSVSLEIGKTYSWYVGLVCQPVQTDLPWVRAEVQRIAGARVSASELEGKTLLEQAALYGREGLWYDTLHSLTQQLQTQPNDPIVWQNWVNLFQSVGLDAISESSRQQWHPESR